MHIASYLEANGCPVAVLPLHTLDPNGSPLWGLTPEHEKEIKEILTAALGRENPSVVGIGSFTLDFPDCLKVLAICKQIDKEVVTVIGGPHVTFQDVECLESPHVDVVVRGEGEWTMLELMSSLEKGRDLSGVAGITFRSDGQVVRTPDRPHGDLCELPPINFELLPPEFVRRAYVQIVSSRGCLYRCRYCVDSMYWGRRRCHPISMVVDEMETLACRYDNQIQGLYDCMLDTRSDRLIELCDAIADRGIQLPPRFALNVRADRVTKRGIEALCRAGVSRVTMGVESASSRVLEMMNRTVTVDQVTAACRMHREAGIKVKTNWIVGHPGDNLQEAEISFRYLKYLLENDLTQDAHVMVFQPYPGTCYFEGPEEYGVEILHKDWSRWNRFDTYPPSQLVDFSADEIYATQQRFEHLVRTYKMIPDLILSAFERVPVDLKYADE
jgi:radical SAM superfamily enzyme YgiQ (UPF0313 family)